MSELERIRQAYADAVYRKDRSAFLALYDKGVVVFDAREEWFYDGAMPGEG